MNDTDVSLRSARVRLLLTALRCEKGEPAANLEAHRRVLDRAAACDADLVVFPEMSLSGSVDVLAHPEHLLSLAAAPVEALVASTRGLGAAVVFGIAERAPDRRAFITQVVARDGAVIA